MIHLQTPGSQNLHGLSESEKNASLEAMPHRSEVRIRPLLRNEKVRLGGPWSIFQWETRSLRWLIYRYMIYTYIYIFIYIYIYIGMYIYIYTSMYEYILYVLWYCFVYMHAYIHTYIHTYKHTYIPYHTIPYQNNHTYLP